MDPCLLELRGYGVSFGDRVILKDIDLCLPDRGMTVLMGPSGTGKSTLLRTLAGCNDASGSMKVAGTALYRREPLGRVDRPAMVLQKPRLIRATLRENLIHELPERESLQLCQQRDLVARMLTSAGLEYLVEALDRCVIDLTAGEKRLVALLRTAAANPKMLFVDEPTVGVTEEEAEQILACLAREAKRRAVVTVLHNQQHARALGGNTVLLAGGSIIESRATEAFFSEPRTALGRDFVRTGSCCAPSPAADDRYLDEAWRGAPETAIAAHEPPPVTAAQASRQIRSDAFGPRNFLWLQQGRLAGTARPGLVLDLALDLASLQRVGISVLVSLESEVAPVSAEHLEPFGIRGLAFPIDDMKAPDLEDAANFCARISSLLDDGEAVALHCKAGLGRTGTMLAACLVWQGSTAADALARAREVEPRWVQSREQKDFLREFEKFVAVNPTGRAPASMLA